MSLPTRTQFCQEDWTSKACLLTMGISTIEGSPWVRRCWYLLNIRELTRLQLVPMGEVTL